jgi:hypothetical protein
MMPADKIHRIARDGSGRSAVGAPAVGAPAVGAPAAGAPAVGAPAVGAPAAGAPAAGAPAEDRTESTRAPNRCRRSRYRCRCRSRSRSGSGSECCRRPTNVRAKGIELTHRAAPSLWRATGRRGRARATIRSAARHLPRREAHVAQWEYSQYGVHVGCTWGTRLAWRREYGNGQWSPGADVAAAHLARRKTASRRPANKTTWAKDKQTSTQTNEQTRKQTNKQTRKQTRKQTPQPNDHRAALRAFGSAEFSEGCDAEHCPP